MLEIRIKQGTGGRWRWLAYDEDTTPDDPDDDRYRAGCTPHGFDSAEDAKNDAISVFGAAAMIWDPVVEAEYFAGLRDFQ